MIDFVNLATFSYDKITKYAEDAAPMELVLSTMNYFRTKCGIPHEKLLMGVPLFAQTKKLLNINGYITTELGSPGPWTNTPGFLAYNEVRVCPVIRYNKRIKPIIPLDSYAQ